MFSRANVRWVLILLSVYVSSRLVFGLAGVRFDDSPLVRFWQIIDIAELRGHLGRSLWYCHAQPPLFNLFIGVVLKFAGDASSPVFQGIYLAISFAGHLGTFVLLTRMGAGRIWAAAIATLAMLSPTAVVTENQLFYDPLIHLFVTWSAVALLDWLEAGPIRAGALFDREAAARPLGRVLAPGRSGGRRHLAVFGSLVLALCLTRSLYHLVFILGVGAYLVLALPARRRAVLTATLVLAATIAGWYAKNLVLFGHFTSSTWMGMNMARVVRHTSNDGEMRRLCEQGVLSEVSSVPPFSPLDQYAPRFSDAGRFSDIPLLAAPYKSTGKPNYFHVGYIAIADLYAGDVVALARRHPSWFLHGYVNSWYNYLRPASVDYWFDENRWRLGYYDRAWGKLLFGRFRLPPIPNRQRAEVYPFFAAALVAALVYGVRRWIRDRHDPGAGRAGASAWTPAQRVVAGYMLLMIGYGMAVGNMFDSGENYRFRYYTGSFYLCLFALFVQEAVTRARQRRGPRGAPDRGRCGDEG